MAIVTTLPQRADRFDRRFVAFLQANSITALRIAIAVVFLWFGFLKFFPDLSPAEDLALRTTEKLTLGLIPEIVNRVVLATWECAIGIGLLIGRWRRAVLLALWAQMAGTFLPLVFFPSEAFSDPFVPTMEGQYIIKNIIIVTGAMVVGATVRDTRARPSRPAADEALRRADG
jgi:uncharacterized membrane protein YkgB